MTERSSTWRSGSGTQKTETPGLFQPVGLKFSKGSGGRTLSGDGHQEALQITEIGRVIADQ